MIDLNKYTEFVKEVTSDQSNRYLALIGEMSKLEGTDKLNLALLLTGALGLSSETGEFTEIVKKMVFQGKPYTEENRYHMKRELGDIAWYWVNACRALGYDPNDVLQENIDKLKARYPGGHFDATHSENRKEGDL